MSKFIYLYRGPATPMDSLTPEQSDEQMQAWGEWIGRLGPALVEVQSASYHGLAREQVR